MAVSRSGNHVRAANPATSSVLGLRVWGLGFRAYTAKHELGARPTTICRSNRSCLSRCCGSSLQSIHAKVDAVYVLFGRSCEKFPRGWIEMRACCMCALESMEPGGIAMQVPALAAEKPVPAIVRAGEAPALPWEAPLQYTIP